MKRFRKILVWLGSEHEQEDVLRRATAVAEVTGARLTLVHVVEPPGRLFRTLYHQADELHSVLVRDWTTRLEKLAGTLSDEGLETDSLVLEGKPFMEVIREVLRNGHDLLVKRAVGGEDGPLFGSVDMHVLRKCPCAVWIVKPGSSPSKRILATVDPDPRDDAINRRILEVATSLTAMRGATLQVLHVWQPFAAEQIAKRVDEDLLARYVEDARRAAKEELDGMLSRVGVDLPDGAAQMARGDAIYAIPEFVRRHDIGLVVMGTVCRVGMSGFLIGNTAEGVLSRVQCTVLTLKPEGFVSPVRLEDD